MTRIRFWKSALFLLFTTIIFSGCFNLEEEFTLNWDGSGTYQAHIWTEKPKQDQTNQEEALKKLTAELKSEHIKIEDIRQETKDNEIHGYISLSFDDITKITDAKFFGKDDRRQFIFKEENGCFIFTSIMGKAKEKSQETPKALMKTLQEFKYKLTVTFPGEIQESNATSFKNNTAQWEYSLSELAEQGRVEFTAKVKKRKQLLPYLLIVLGIILGIAVLYFAFEGKGKKQTPEG